MSKRFEDTRAPILRELLLAYELFRLEDMLGPAGRNTAFAVGMGDHGDHCVFHTIPGEWMIDDIRSLIRDAYGGVATTRMGFGVAAVGQ